MAGLTDLWLIVLVAIALSALVHGLQRRTRARRHPRRYRIRTKPETPACTGAGAIRTPHPLALLLDFDGTLVPITATPDAIAVSDDLRALMAEAMARLDGRVAIISGRSLEQLDALWGESLSGVTVAASHGLELRSDGLLSAPEHSALFARLARETHKRRWRAQGRGDRTQDLASACITACTNAARGGA